MNQPLTLISDGKGKATNRLSARVISSWLKDKLFSSPLNIVLTLGAGASVALITSWIFNWAVLSADFSGTTSQDCRGEGACWIFIKVHFAQFIYGLYPDDARWRVNTVLGAFAATIFLWKISSRVHHKWLWLWTTLFFPYLAWQLLYGGRFGLEVIETPLWGGLSLTLIVATVGIATSLPLGILLALARRSSLLGIRSFAVMFIELWRGVPLITVLFMSSVMLPLFFPVGFQFDKLARALIGVSLFSAAYLAEVIRGGLAAIPKGQYDAATALGLNYGKSMGLVILPQALRIVIPGIVNNFIGLFKDTSLVAIIGMFDLLGIVQAAATSPEWIGYSAEGYVFAAAVFWIFCFAMSRYSQRLEKKLKNDR